MVRKTYDEVKEISSQFTSRTEFRNTRTSVYLYAIKMGWLDLIPPPKIKPNGYYTYDICKVLASKYKDKKTFRKKHESAYNVSRKNGWLNEICKHMEAGGRKDLRYIYVFEFNDNHAYIGLGWDINVRESQHMSKNKKNNSSVKEHMDRTNSTYQLKKITNEPVNLIEAGKLENEIIDQYRENGWVVLNKIRGGSIGGSIRKWSYNNCKNKSLECKTRHEFQKKFPGAYDSALNNGWLYKLFPQPKKEYRPRGYYTYEVCGELAKKFKRRSHMCKSEYQCYETIKKNGWLELLSHMEYGNSRYNIIWDYERTKEEASKYSRRVDFLNNSLGAYKASLRNKWLDDFFPKNN